MSKADRAKQFLPFDALKGLQAELRKKEMQVEAEDRKELSEERYKELEVEFNKIEIGNKVRITYYKNKRYVSSVGKVTRIDYLKNKIQVNNQNINASDVSEILVLN